MVLFCPWPYFSTIPELMSQVFIWIPGSWGRRPALTFCHRTSLRSGVNVELHDVLRLELVPADVGVRELLFHGLAAVHRLVNELSFIKKKQPDQWLDPMRRPVERLVDPEPGDFVGASKARCGETYEKRQSQCEFRLHAAIISR